MSPGSVFPSILRQGQVVKESVLESLRAELTGPAAKNRPIPCNNQAHAWQPLLHQPRHLLGAWQLTVATDGGHHQHRQPYGNTVKRCAGRSFQGPTAARALMSME